MDVLTARQLRWCMDKGRGVSGCSGNIPPFNQRIDNRIRIFLRLFRRYIGYAAQFQRHRQQAARHRVVFAKTLSQRQPGFAAGFIKRLTAGDLRQQLHFTAQPARQRLNLRPGVRCGVKMRQGIPVAVQVNHQVRLAGHAHQGEALGLQFGFGDAVAVVTIDGVANQSFVFIFTLCQRASQFCRQRIAQRREATVKILTRKSMKTSEVSAVPVLTQRERIRDRHQGDFGFQLARRLQRQQLLLEIPRHRHARQFIAVQRRLNIYPLL